MYKPFIWLIFLPLFSIAQAGDSTAKQSVNTKIENKTSSPELAGKTSLTENQLALQTLLSADIKAALLINNMPKFFQDWQKNPFAKLWANKKIRKRFSETLRSIEQPRWELYSQRIFGQPSKDLIKMFTGQLVLIYPNSEQQESISLIADIGNNQKQLKQLFVQQMKYQIQQLGEGEQYVQEDEDFLDANIHSRYLINQEKKKEHFSWTVIDNYWFASRSKAQLQSLIARYQDKNLAENWSEISSYQNVTSAQNNPDWVAYLSTAPLMALVQEKVQEFNLQIDDQNANESQQYLELIQKTGLESFYLVAKSNEQHTLLDMSIFYQDNSWLMSLFKHQNTELKWPAFLPKNALSASTSSVDLGQLWKNLVNLPEKSSIFASIIPMLQMQMQSYSQTSGVDLEGVLTDGFGQQLFFAQLPLAQVTNANPEISQKDQDESEQPSGNTLLAISLQDRQTVEMAINGLQKAFLMSELFQHKNYLDTQIYYYNPDSNENIRQSNNLVVYAISNEQLFYSNNLAVMETAIEQQRYKKSEDTIASLAAVKQVMDNLPPHAFDVTFYQGAYFTKSLLGLLELAQSVTIESQQRYSCGGNSNPAIAQQLEQEKAALSQYQGYFQSVLTSQHQADNFYRLHAHINH